ncbi:uncharacterized protein si:dkey-30j10.5 [Gambusia affinis]|uniref:uncharacterized protein si:dkey-30j10.5 n=1 Tax=Gambusia affinis TaxID=33528 RepID=UPI001CDCDDDB|nr:uncharacterized protein si:dkey-30j10.5 [Gambusia affinis]XP_043968099.1 uncharacterized protein si:dkey-30j10.5 [Gambusia affinis]
MQQPKMPKFITHIDISLNAAEELQLSNNGFTKLPLDLNKEAGGNNIFLWYKMGDYRAITRIQFSFNDWMTKGLMNEGYHLVNKDLHKGAGGSNVFLWFFKGYTECDVPIVELDVSTNEEDETKKAQPQWERSACDLNRRAGGDGIHLWMKRQRQTYICDIQASDGDISHHDLFRQGYTRIDEDINRDSGGPDIFIFYQQTADEKKAITDLKISTDTSKESRLVKAGCQKVKTNLNDGTRGTPLYLWYKKGGTDTPPITFITVINTTAKEECVRAGFNVIDTDLNLKNSGHKMFLCFK